MNIRAVAFECLQVMASCDYRAPHSNPAPMVTSLIPYSTFINIFELTYLQTNMQLRKTINRTGGLIQTSDIYILANVTFYLGDGAEGGEGSLLLQLGGGANSMSAALHSTMGDYTDETFFKKVVFCHESKMHQIRHHFY